MIEKLDINDAQSYRGNTQLNKMNEIIDWINEHHIYIDQQTKDFESARTTPDIDPKDNVFDE